VINRVLPDAFGDAGAATAAAAMVDDDTLPERLSSAIGEEVSAELLSQIGRAYLTYNRLSREGARQRQRLQRQGKVPIAMVPLVTERLSDLAELVRIASTL